MWLVSEGYKVFDAKRWCQCQTRCNSVQLSDKELFEMWHQLKVLSPQLSSEKSEIRCPNKKGFLSFRQNELFSKHEMKQSDSRFWNDSLSIERKILRTKYGCCGISSFFYLEYWMLDQKWSTRFSRKWSRSAPPRFFLVKSGVSGRLLIKSPSFSVSLIHAQ